MARKDFSKAEEEFQIVQNHYEIHRDVESKQKMFLLIQAAVFNALNKKLEKIIEHEEIENYSYDITMNMLKTIDNKIRKNKPWKISKLSSAVHKPCLFIYRAQKQFEDKIGHIDLNAADDDFSLLDEMEFTYQDGVLKQTNL